MQESYDKAKQSQTEREATQAFEVATLMRHPKGLSDVTAATATTSAEEIKARARRGRRRERIHRDSTSSLPLTLISYS